jgi:hypothetical protein
MIAAVTCALVVSALSLSQYRQRLSSIDELLLRGDKALAAAEARELLDQQIRGEEEIAPDRWVLGPIARGEPGHARLKALLAGFGDGESAATPEPDRELLTALRRAEERELPLGGQISPLPAPEISLFDTLAGWLRSARQRIRQGIRALVEWLVNLFYFSANRSRRDSGRITPVVLIAVAAIAVFIAALAILSQRRRLSPARTLPTAAHVAEDENPLSRTADGWEERARKLAQQRRAREAIRAWYHAVLVHCYGAGVLHYGRGRTNWEYAYALSPALPWRSRFLDLTRSFDLEWYGRSESSMQALDTFALGAAEILRALGRP